VTQKRRSCKRIFDILDHVSTPEPAQLVKIDRLAGRIDMKAGLLRQLVGDSRVPRPGTRR
jgi:hypothetical protein